MKVQVEWLDGEVRAYDNVETVSVGADGVLRMYGYRSGGGTPLVGEVPIFGVREWTREDER